MIIFSSIWSKNIQKGILLHRFIDHYTDTNPHYLAGKRRFYEKFPKMGGVINDILYDYLLWQYELKHKNIQLDEKKHTMYYFIFMFWIILLGVFLYICFKIYISNKVPSITFYIFFIAAVISFYYIYLNFKNYFDF